MATPTGLSACGVGGVLIAEVSRESCLCIVLPVALIACGVGG